MRSAHRGQAIVEVALIVPVAILLVLGAYDTSVMGSDKTVATSAVRNGARLASQIGGVGTTPPANTCSGAAPASLTMAQADAQIVAAVLASTTNMTYLGGGTSRAGFPDEIDIYRPADPGGKINKASDPYESYTPETTTLATTINSGSTNNFLSVAATSSAIPAGTSVTLTVGPNSQNVVTSAAVPAGATNIPVNSFVASNTYPANSTVVGATTLNFTFNHHSSNTYTMAMRCQGPLGNEAEIGVRMQWTYKPANGIPGPSFVFDDGAAVGHLPADWAVEKLMLCVENCIIR
ncbi:MAG: hypothetical protein QOK05_2823 [Chloroflexota bacterium]|jgi:hypothetical protein|nr:hypothetical protein [Chloroflexota bacterium]